MPMHLAPGAGCCPAGVSGQNLPLPYSGGELRGELGLFGEKLRILGGRGRIQLQELNLAAQLGREVYFVPAMALRAQFERAGGEPLVDEGRGRFGVVGDVGLGGPLGV